VAGDAHDRDHEQVVWGQLHHPGRSRWGWEGKAGSPGKYPCDISGVVHDGGSIGATVSRDDGTRSVKGDVGHVDEVCDCVRRGWMSAGDGLDWQWVE
jgi:hypothetical protein